MTNPLTPEDKKRIDEALGMIKLTESQIVRAEQAGIDVSAQKAKLATLKDNLKKIRSVYFPTGG